MTLKNERFPAGLEIDFSPPTYFVVAIGRRPSLMPTRWFLGQKCVVIEHFGANDCNIFLFDFWGYCSFVV